MSEFTLNATLRTDLGKGASRRLRRNANLVPAVIYGANKEAVSVSLEQREVARLLLNDAAYSSILALNIDGKTESVLIKDLQRHPSKGFVMHADFIRVVAGQKLTTIVPVHYLNEETCAGVKAGGELFRVTPEVEVSCLPKDLPEAINLDLTNVELGQVVHLADLVAPKGVEFVALAHEQNPVIANIEAPRAQEEDASEEAAEGEAEEK
ncbi:50S ribosomal protein L25/general stress protein Ctc [Pseudomonas sp. F1_0610]|uniref:50S ribosomal protein L25/general stress protein Ctc n=1 Tax=Pseudomonas sp. F1_0610 TaxID=3114284 RepID=UPI0039C45BD9